ncbi:MAG: xanthine phosphoribosyltransferase [Ruminococcaceae bacterium]|nr:xanthine phosphoribosyltransferase [Oscillospiraceae bacterium]
MKLLEDRIRKDGKVFPGDVLKVDSFLNHQIDVDFISQLCLEWKRLYEGTEITKILTIEASGIAIASVAALHFNVPLLFAKKTKTVNISADVYTAKVESYTHKTTYDIIVSKEFLKPCDKVLIIDDFLANGKALEGLIKLCEDAGATVAGIGIAVEKACQRGGDLIRSKGYRVESLARVSSMSVEGGVEFC